MNEFKNEDTKDYGSIQGAFLPYEFRDQIALVLKRLPMAEVEATVAALYSLPNVRIPKLKLQEEDDDG